MKMEMPLWCFVVPPRKDDERCEQLEWRTSSDKTVLSHVSCHSMTPTKKFQRTIEDFTCEHCGFFVYGTGYTNHCPQCLWSKHVDVHPGDRMATCGGLMEPTALETNGSERILTHRCVHCEHEKRNKISTEDDFETLIALSRQFAERVAL